MFKTGISVIDYIKLFLYFKIIVKLRNKYAPYYAKKDMPADVFLTKVLGMSSEFVDSFARPSPQSVFLCPLEEMSSQAMEFILDMLVNGDVALPAGGVQAIPDQIAGRLPPGSVKLGVAVEELRKDGVRLCGDLGMQYFDAVVLATDWGAAARLIGTDEVGIPQFSRSSTTWYFRFKGQPPVQKRHVFVPVSHGSKMVPGTITNAGFPNMMQQDYAPKGWSLCQVTTVGLADETDEGRLRNGLEDFFGPSVHTWEMFKKYEVKDHQASHVTRFAHHNASAEDIADTCSKTTDGESRGANSWLQPARLKCGLYCCGDYRAHPGVDGALQSGKRAAAAICADLGIQVASAQVPKLCTCSDELQPWIPLALATCVIAVVTVASSRA